MKHVFVLDDAKARIQIEGVTKRSVRVAFDQTDLGMPAEPPQTTRWFVSDKHLNDTQKFRAMRFVNDGVAGWIMEPGTRFVPENPRFDGDFIEVCDKWLKKLFGEVPPQLYFRQTSMR